MKYIDAEKLIAEIERLNSLVSYESKDRHDEGLHDAYKAIKNVITTLQQEQPIRESHKGSWIEETKKELQHEEELLDMRLETLRRIRDKKNQFQQEQPELTQVPRIEQETQKKGWMDYGLLISEIGLHRSNVINRIKETKKRATEIKRNIAPHDLAILCEYLESVGAEIVLCCLQRYCMDFMFTQGEVKEILQQEQPEVDLEKEITEHAENMPHGEFTHDSECREHEEWAMKEFRHFYELGLNARKE